MYCGIGPFLIQQIQESNISVSCTIEIILGMYICVVYEIGPNQWYFRFHGDTVCGIGPFLIQQILESKILISCTSNVIGLAKAGDADSSRAPGLTSDLQGSVNVHCGTLLLVPQ